ncbi:MAG: ABC transporter ATP-binding protein [Candidatus Paraimprobicoccus trichonymphae]|uniref:ABC transporter ATP-binding protein n=1 Tax=Candidatus Paraimprobicoccus trichonymphae TaxID=3033793 RepID=A0AA48I9B9_9FIRM|nr:MAG: ABC transporter ATP-binding protein [Candidatus Paraimprobicoccus trichonymphae]
MIEIKNLVKKYSNKTVLNKINFTVSEGEILGFLGPNGAGKSTTMNIITGYIAPTNGTVVIDDVDIMKNPKKAKLKIGYLPEIPPLYIDMTVKSYLDFMYNLKKIKFSRQNHIEEVCKSVEIQDVYNKIIKKLSKGYKQRVGIAQALLGYPPVIILDEPTVGLDPNQIISVRKLIKSLGKKHTVIISSHILSEIQAVSDRVVVISKGKIVADNTVEGIEKMSSRDSNIVLQIDGDQEEVENVLKTVEGIKKIKDIFFKEKNVYEYIIEFDTNIDVRRNIFKILSEKDFTILKFDIVKPSLEDVFIKLTSANYVENNNNDDSLNYIKDSENNNGSGKNDSNI